MRIAFLGTPRIAVPTLEAVLAAGHVVSLVVSQPDRPRGRSSRPVPPPVKETALASGIPLVQPLKVRSEEFLDVINSSGPDVLVVVAYGRILPGSVLRTARRGAINVHFSLLPRYRGAAPVQWALARGETVTGVTTMAMNEFLDEGDVLLQREVSIGPHEHCPQLQDRLAAVGASLLVETLSRLDSGQLEPSPQNHTLATYAPPLRRDDGEGDLSLPAREVEGRVRGFDPWPGVWVRASRRRLRIVEAKARNEVATGAPLPGRVLSFEGDAFRIACGAGSLLDVLAVQPEGRKALTARQAFNGHILVPGDQLEVRRKG